MSVSVKNNNVDQGIRAFNTQVAKNGILSKARERANGYKKKGVRLREEKKQNTINSRRNSRKKNREMR